MIDKNTLRAGMILALCTALISGFSNFIAKIAVTSVKNPVIFTTLKNAVVACLLIGIILIGRSRKELRSLSKKSWVRMILIGIIGGSVPFVLYFTGLSHTTALSASFIHKTLFIWVALLAYFFTKERFSFFQAVAFFFLILGTAVLGGKGQLHFGKPELMILGATFLWAIENIIAKHALKEVSSTLLAGSRMVFGSILLTGFVFLQGKQSLLVSLQPTQWLWTIIPAVLLLGYVLTWYAALKRAPVTLVTSLLVPATFITTMLSGIFITKTISSQDLVSGACIIGAVALISIVSLRKKTPYAADTNVA